MNYLYNEKDRFIVYTMKEWENLSDLDRNDGYGVWAWIKNNHYIHGYQNVFLKKPKDYTTHVIWISKDRLNEVLSSNDLYNHPFFSRWHEYLKYIHRNKDILLKNDPNGKFKENIDFYELNILKVEKN